MSRTTDVAIIGAGAIGCALAWELARRGVDVTVVERDVPGSGATRAAGGMLSPIAEASAPGPFLDLALASMERWPAFVEAVREASVLPVEYRAQGKLLVALDDARAASLRTAYEWRRAQGHGVEWLGGAAARALEPALSGEVVAGLFIAGDHWVDNRRLGEALWVAAARQGARFALGERVVSVERREGGGAHSVAGVVLEGGDRISAARVVVAAGSWSGTLSGLPRPLPVVPIRGQMIRVRAVPPVVERVVMAGHGYVIPRGDGRILIGATEERVGFRHHPTPAGVASLLGTALQAVPALAEASFETAWAGLRPGTPDGQPILGPDPEVAGLYYATGHYRNGILLAPITAEVVADAITGANPVVPLEPFAVDRFRAMPALA